MWLKHSVPPGQYPIVGHAWWLSTCCSSMVEHSQLKEGVLVWIPVAADISSFLYLYNSLYFYFQCETRYFKHNPVLWYSKTHCRSMYYSSHLQMLCNPSAQVLLWGLLLWSLVLLHLLLDFWQEFWCTTASATTDHGPPSLSHPPTNSRRRCQLPIHNN